MFLPTNITLKFGDSGDFVAELQRRLSAVKCFQEVAINGFYDGNTVNGVTQFQTLSGIPADGVAGPETLRRLNGAISGDFASGSAGNTNAEEEEKRRQQQAEALQRQQWMEEQARQAELERQMLAQQQQQQYQQSYQPQAMSPAPTTYEPQAYPPPQASAQPYAPPPQPMQNVPPPAAPSASEMLAQMLTSAPPQQGQQTHSVAPQQPPIPTPATATYAPAQAPQQTYQPPSETALPQAAQQAESSRGLVGRAMQYANEVIGKLAAYFESKLPRQVIDEVKQIGHAMAAAGVKEVPIPQSPEQQRERGVEQQRGQQQGRQVG